MNPFYPPTSLVITPIILTAGIYVGWLIYQVYLTNWCQANKASEAEKLLLSTLTDFVAVILAVALWLFWIIFVGATFL